MSTDAIRPLVEEDDPSHSAAALCIEIELLQAEFRPVFTHQCFEGEWIRGYRPPRSIWKAVDGAPVHSSHRLLEPTRYELAIHVTLAPSCRRCHVQVDFQKVKRDLPVVHNTRRRSSRRKIETDDQSRKTRQQDRKDNQEDDEDHSDDHDDEEDDEKDDDEENDDNADDDDDGEYFFEEQDSDEEEERILESPPGAELEGATRKRRMPVEEILLRLGKALPELSHNHPSSDASTKEQQNVRNDYLRRPLGIALEEYQANQDTFVLCLAQGSSVAEYQQQVQKLALFFIETAEEVQMADEREGSWNVLYLFRKHSASKYSLAGYMTLYVFHSPFRKPVSGSIVRVCQVVLWPPYQRSGHGRRMLHAVYDWCHGQMDRLLPESLKLDDIVEINVEDPAPAFVTLRNRVDYERFLRNQQEASKGSSNFESENASSNRKGKASKPDSPAWFAHVSQSSCPLDDDDYFSPLTDAQLTEVSSRVKFTKHQVHTVYEMHVWKTVQEYLATSRKLKKSESRSREELEKKYRLMVKMRLNKTHREELGACASKLEMQQLLDLLYEQTMAGYRSILEKVHNGSKY